MDNDWAAGPLFRILSSFVDSDWFLDIKEFETFGNLIHSSLLLVALRLLIGSEVLPPALAGVLWEGWGLHGYANDYCGGGPKTEVNKEGMRLINKYL